MLISPRMSTLTYIVSNYGAGIAVGIKGDYKLAEQDATLAENIFGCNHADHLFSRLLYMRDVQQFKKFLILKEYFLIWDEHFTRNKVSGTRNKAQIMKFTRRAIKRARLVMEAQVTYENFMSLISARNNEFVLGFYQDDTEDAA
jgi:hypothetical protein